MSFIRTHHGGLLSKENVGQEVSLSGWVQKRRDLGGVIFIDLRDRSGIVQIVFNPEVSKEALEIAEKVRNEYVLSVTGKVVNRDPETVNLSLLDVGGAVLSVSQFTLYGDCRKGRRPNFMEAARPEQALRIYESFNDALRGFGIKVETGRFGEMMDVQFTNWGPVTLIVES